MTPLLDAIVQEQHQLIKKTAKEFSKRHIAPVSSTLDEFATFPTENIKRMASEGLMNMEVAEQYGGAGLDTLSYVLALHEVAKADASHATIMSVTNSLYCAGLEMFGSEKQKETFLSPLSKKKLIGAYSLSESTSGSDASSLKTRAEKSGDFYLINGSKSWVTSGPHADHIILFASTDPSNGHRGISAFIIDTSRPGFSAGKSEPKMGIRASATSEIHFEKYKCPKEHMLGEEGQGFSIAMSLLDGGRIGIATQALGIAERALELSIDYALERKAFGKKIAQFQMIQQKLADMKCKVEASRLLIYQAAVAKENSKQHPDVGYTLEASMAKLVASETAGWVCNQAIQIHGGLGYSKEYPLEQLFRDARITEIYEGTSEIQRLVIARQLTGVK